MDDFFDFMFDLKQIRNKRQYSKIKIKDLNSLLKMETKKIENDSEKFVLNILHKNEEHIIIYHTNLEQNGGYGLFFIELKVIEKKGIVLNRIRLSAKFTNKETIELCDLEVFGENEGRGYGSILLDSLINFAKDNSIKTILGWISYADKDHFDKLDYFYKKHGFNVIWGRNNNMVNKAADIIWTNS